MVFIHYGLSILNLAVLDLVPPGRFFSLDDVYQQLAARRRLAAFVVRRRFYEIGSFDGLADFRRYLASHKWVSCSAVKAEAP